MFSSHYFAVSISISLLLNPNPPPPHYWQKQLFVRLLVLLICKCFLWNGQLRHEIVLTACSASSAATHSSRRAIGVSEGVTWSTVSCQYSRAISRVQAWHRDHRSGAHPYMYSKQSHFRFSPSFSSPLSSSLMTYTHSNTPKHKKSRPQLRQAISLTVQSVFFPMMFPTGTGRRKSDLLPHRAHAVALIWKMISVLLEPINIILVSPVNDTFLPRIVGLTEEEMSVRGMKTWGGRGGGSLEGLTYNWGVLQPLNCILTSSHPLRHAIAHGHTTNRPWRNLRCRRIQIKPPCPPPPKKRR